MTVDGVFGETTERNVAGMSASENMRSKDMFRTRAAICTRSACWKLGRTFGKVTRFDVGAGLRVVHVRGDPGWLVLVSFWMHDGHRCEFR